MARFRGVRFLISPQVDAQTSDAIRRLLFDEGAVATDELVGLDDCDLYVTHLSASQLVAGSMPAPAHSRGLRMLLSSDLNSNAPPQQPTVPHSEGGGGGGSAAAPLSARLRDASEGGMRSGLISSPRLGGGSDSMLRRALRVPSVECVPARSLLAQLVARSDARNGARGGSDSPPAAPTAARGSTPSAYMLPRSVKVRPAAERNGGQTQPSMRPPASLAHADERGGAAGELVDAEGGRAPAEAAVAAVGAAGGAQGGRPAERPPSLSERPPVLSDRPPAAQPLARTASIMRAESLCTTEASHGTGVTTLSATATQLHAAAAGTRAHQGLGVSATAAVGARAPAAASHQPSEMQPRTAVPQLARKPLGVPLVSPPGMPTGTRLDGALVQHGSAGHHTVIVVPPRAGVTGAPTTIRRPLEPSLQQRTAGGAAAGQGGAITVYAECAQLTISDLAGRYKPLTGSLDVQRLRRMWPRRVAAVQRAAAAGQYVGGAPRASTKRPLAHASAGAVAQARSVAAKAGASATVPPAKLSRCDVCECRFADLDEHLVSQRHREVVDHPDYFKELDAFIARHGLGVGGDVCTK